jgi:electron transfer flavoprotein alpha subunit
MNILIIAEHDNQSLKPATLHAVTAAIQLGKTIDILVIGNQCTTVAQAASQIVGISSVKLIQAPYLEQGLADNHAKQILAIAHHYTAIIFPATSSGKNIAPRVAAVLDLAQISDILSVVSNTMPYAFTRPMYAGNVIATVATSDNQLVLTVRTTSFDAASYHNETPARIDDINAVTDVALSQFISRDSVHSVRPELTVAKIVVSGGRALGSAAQFTELLTPLADILNAAMGASRAAVDSGYAPNDWQVGQTGKIIAPQLYIAVGISGAIQHLAGMKESKVIVAINKDPDAPIFQVADYGLVADLFDAIPELTAQLSSAV